MVTPPQQFCVRWNSYQSNLQNAFPKLLTSEHFVDVTLACENEMLKCHKVVLSACSTYFEKLLLDNPCQHPIIFMKDMKFSEMQSLVDFMYKGEVNVTQDDLPSLLKSAEALQIRGLCGSDQLLNPTYFGNIRNMQQHVQHPFHNPAPKMSSHIVKTENIPQPSQVPMNKEGEPVVKKEGAEGSDSGNNPSSSECDSNDGMLQIKEDIEEEPDDSFFDGDSELMDQELTEEDGTVNTDVKPQFSAIANVSCQYDGAPGSANRRIRRSDEELRRAAECITRGQTFQTVSDQFNIPISTIRFYMARKGILPRRKRGRACAGPLGVGMGMPISTSYNSPASPIGPPYHIVHYKLPALGVSKLK
ncbi:zinc finger and BTB domain-containing protein 14-like [Anoplophora glabripennis]|uniref:zinc finger and BTB domain-containing protein 14-like n=1 Tax=Anoplophora glabripennis TaxID=217634 RepID=UPI00087582AC|nr:zinc finger and BTB domain-containing protein 14-like [Anoplophora glabripennis]XP_018575442.1 zinc finger and BTB domain-containing protein 14-like [Anoplophora glabripennis]XP_018575443.1 zinc finger and BTB domain-containing protein 14-like [Anoplophora glabripennis]XP_018575444.1 zinc finger and BTB domain-containing protein 14-like [Anoplophora glabripennis]